MSARALLAVVVLTGGVCAVGAHTAAGDTLRTESKLGGFSIGVTASPIQVLLDDPSLPIPRPPGSAVIEADPNYTSANLDTGPNGRAIASSLWPGTLFGEGLNQVAVGAGQYPIKAESRYPDKPFTAQGPDGGVTTRSSTLGLDVNASAVGAPEASPGVVDVGAMTSRSGATVNGKDMAVGTSVSKISNVDLLAGIIHIGSVSTTLEAHSDGKAPGSTGTTTVAGLSVAGQAFTVDDKGVHAAGQGSSLPAGANPLAQLGISIEGIVNTSTATPSTATRTAAGLRITVDTGPLRTMLSPVLGPLQDPLGTVISQIPEQAQGYLYYALGATPKITFILGSSQVSASAVQPLTFDFPPSTGLIGGFQPTLPVAPGTSGTSGTGGTPALPGVGTAGAPTLPPVDAPVVSAPELAPRSAASAPDPFGGIGPVALLGGGLISGLIGWGLMRLLPFAFLSGAAGPGCHLGAPTDLPHMRGA